MLFAVIGLGFGLTNLPPIIKSVAISRLILRVISRHPMINYSGGETIEGGLKGNIEFKNVCFAYPTRPDIKVLIDFNMTVKQGQNVALVGSSGSGKSTIVGLLERFYTPISGDIILDGVDIKKLDPLWLHKEIGIVTQEPVLFACSIKENILYGVHPKNFTDDDIIKCAKAANAHDFIMNLPKKYDTLVGERGAQLSGGQKQRVAIARAMLQNPKILLLDEATSALDTESEHLVQEALEKLMIGKTSIVIAHRLTTIQNSDQIFVLDKGKLVESGKHDDLVERNGVYALLANRQMAFGGEKKKYFN